MQSISFSPFGYLSIRLH